MSPTVPTKSLRRTEYDASCLLASLVCVTDRIHKAENLYEVLNVPQNATQQEIQDAFEREKATVDPNNQGRPNVDRATKATLNLYDAYAVLSDDNQRRKYDASLLSEPHDNNVNNLFDVNDSHLNIKRYYKDMPKSKAYSEVFHSLFSIYLTIHSGEKQWIRRRHNRIYGGSTHHLVEATGNDYQTYFTNMRFLALQMAHSDELHLSRLSSTIRDFCTAIRACFHHDLFGTDRTKAWLKMLWNEMERIESWVKFQSYAAEWYSKQVDLHLELHLLEAKALHVWPIYQATSGSPPTEAFYPNCVPELSEVQVIRLIRLTAFHRQGIDRGMLTCCEGPCTCGYPPAAYFDIATRLSRIEHMTGNVLSPLLTVG